MKRQVPVWYAVLLLVACCLSLDLGAEAARVEEIDGLRVVRLSGTPYELGRQHGEALRDEVRAAVGQVLGYFRSYLKVPIVRSLAVNWWLDSAWDQARPFIPQAYQEELRGLADGSGVPLRELRRLHAIPERTYCSNFAAWGGATSDGRLIHVRNLDWNIGAGIQRFPVVFVVRPATGHAFVNIGWAGFIGVLTGVNDAELSIGQIGAETKAITLRGEPMALLMRRVLEEADDVDEAAAIIRDAHRTVGVNYVIAQAKATRAVALETNAKSARLFEANDPAERSVPYARPMEQCVFRADAAIDPEIRERQTASDGDPRRPGLEMPGGSAYEVRYLGVADGLRKHYGRLDAARAQEIAKSIAPDSNIQSVIFAWPDLWIANAQGRTPAAQTTYHQLNAAALLQQ